MQRWFPISWCGLLLAVACGGGAASRTDLCQRLANPPSKQGNCPTLVDNIPIFDETKCNTALASCDDSDETALNGLADCFVALPACVRGDEVAFTTRIASCEFNAPTSGQCHTALQAAVKTSDRAQ